MKIDEKENKRNNERLLRAKIIDTFLPIDISNIVKMYNE